MHVNTVHSHAIKPGTLEHGTTAHGTPRNSGGTTEHLGTLTEHQRNTPEQRNLERRRAIAFMRLLQTEIQQIFRKYLKKAGLNVNTFLRILPYKNFEKTRIFMNCFYVAVVFYYCHLEQVYTKSEVNSNQFEISNHFEMSFRLHGNLHGDFTAATFQTMARLYCTCVNDIF